MHARIVLPDKADAVIAFHADPQIQARIEELAQKSTEGQLTEEERWEDAGSPKNPHPIE